MSDIMKKRLEDRLAAMKKAVEQSMANHNSLVGRYQEASETLLHWDELNKPEVEPDKESHEAEETHDSEHEE